MVPFRVFDRDKKTTWVVINYHPNQTGGEYLVAREDDTEKDGELSLVTAKVISKMKLVDFCDEQD